MAVSYNKLWKLMIDKKINKSKLCKKIKISSSTMAKMTNEEMVAMTVLEKICAELECDISDIMEFTDLAEVKKKIHNENTSPDNGTVNRTTMNENGLNYIDLFAGAGGLSEGFIQSGYRPVAHVEMNEHAAKTIETRIAYYYLKDNGKIKI